MLEIQKIQNSFICHALHTWRWSIESLLKVYCWVYYLGTWVYHGLPRLAMDQSVHFESKATPHSILESPVARATPHGAARLGAACHVDFGSFRFIPEIPRVI